MKIRLKSICLALCSVVVVVSTPSHAAEMQTKSLSDQGLEKARSLKPYSAISLYSLHLAAHPDDAEALARRSSAFLTISDIPRAIADAEAAINIAPNKSYGYYARYDISSCLGRTALTGADAAKILSFNEPPVDDTFYWLSRARLLQRNGQFNAAKKAKDRAMELCPKDDSPRSLLRKANIFFAKDEYEKAKRLVDQSIKKDPDEPYAYGLRASIEYNLKDWKAVISDFSRYLSAYPKDFYAHWSTGVAKYNLNDNEGALKSLDRTLELAPNYTFGYIWRGQVYAFMGDQTKAIDDFSKAITLDPLNWFAIHQRAHCFYKNNQTRFAAQDFAKAERMAPKDWITMYCCAMFYREQKNYDKSIECFTQSIKLHPKYGLSFCARGNAHMLAGHYKQAIADCTQSLNLFPQRSHPHFSRGISYGKLKQYDLAIKDLTEAIDLQPGYGEAYYERSKVYKAMGKPDLERKDLELAAKNNYKPAVDMK